MRIRVQIWAFRGLGRLQSRRGDFAARQGVPCNDRPAPRGRRKERRSHAPHAGKAHAAPLPDDHAGAICLSLRSVRATNFPEVDTMKHGARGPGGGIVTAALLVIGDEILSGRTKDKNIGYIADYLTAIGIDLKEVRVVGDDAAAIVEAVNTLRARHTYLFTTGGIGPTHDDITADCVAKAFGVSIDHDPRAVAILRERFLTTGAEMNEARMRMTRIPAGADLVHNKVSAAPGFWLDNVIVMAGVPTIM